MSSGCCNLCRKGLNDEMLLSDNLQQFHALTCANCETKHMTLSAINYAFRCRHGLMFTSCKLDRQFTFFVTAKLVHYLFSFPHGKFTCHVIISVGSILTGSLSNRHLSFRQDRARYLTNAKVKFNKKHLGPNQHLILITLCSLLKSESNYYLKNIISCCAPFGKWSCLG